MSKQNNEVKSDYLALYRKYRPQEFKSVIGQDLAVEMLQNAIQNNRIHHAYVFYGDRGIGKTTLARIFAKEIGSTPEDIFELDAASNTGVDDMRLIIEATKTSTFGSKYKVYILDEAHMLSNSASNALLKTLEEPPVHVIFILATTRKDKIPNTIISRCQTIDFVSPSIEILSKVVEKISKAENKSLAREVVLKIAEAGRGSFRDTLGVLEKVITVVNKDKITLTDINELFNLIPENQILNLLESILEVDIKKIFNSLNQLDLNTDKSVIETYLNLIKLFELALYLRFVDIQEAKKVFLNSIEESTILKVKDLTNKYATMITSKNLDKLLNLEENLISNNNLNKTVFINGLINLIEDKISS